MNNSQKLKYDSVYSMLDIFHHKVNKFFFSCRSPSAVIYKSEEAQKPAPYVASFSSRGPNPGSEYLLKV